METENSCKSKDRTRIIAYIERRGSVPVRDIIEHSGASSLRVYPILFELEDEEVIEVTRRETLGAPEVVSMKEK